MVRPGYFEKGIATPMPFSSRRNPSFETIKSTPSVEVATPRLAFSGLVSLGDATVAFIGGGRPGVRAHHPRIAITEGQDLTTTRNLPSFWAKVWPRARGQLSGIAS